MTLQEIAIFKRFIGQHELRKNFIAKYRKSIGMTRNPESIEKYLSNIEPTKVITSAVKHFITNEAMGFDFWQSVNESWLQYLKKMQVSHTIEQENPINLRGYFSALRENWDKEKPWVYDPISVAQLRYGITPPPRVDERKENANQDDKPAEPESHEESPCPEIDFVDIAQYRKTGKLEKGVMSINNRNRSARITINRPDSIDLVKKHLPKVRLGRMGNDVVIQFNNISGNDITINSDAYINVNNTKFTRTIHSMLHLTEELAYVRMEKISENSTQVTFKIIKQ